MTLFDSVKLCQTLLDSSFNVLVCAICTQVMFDMVGAGDSRLKVTDNPLHKLWVYLEQLDNDRVGILNKLADATQDGADSVLSILGMDRSMWAVSATSLVFSETWAKRGPPTVSTSPPGYHAYVNLGCCLESLLLNDFGDSDEVGVLEALETDGLEPEAFLNRRPGVESWLYKVSLVTFLRLY